MISLKPIHDARFQRFYYRYIFFKPHFIIIINTIINIFFHKVRGKFDHPMIQKQFLVVFEYFLTSERQ